MNEMLSEKDARAIDQILIDQLSVKRELLVRDAGIMADLGADSLDVAEISMAIEERFDLSVPDERWDRVETVGDLHDAVAGLLLEKRERV